MVSNNFMEIRRGGGVFEHGNPWGGGAKAVSDFRWKEGSKNRAFHWGEGVWIFSGIIH